MRLYATKDTYYGTSYSKGGQPNDDKLTFGGWGDWYYSYIEWDLTNSPKADQIIKAEACFTVSLAAPNDPEHKLCRVTSAWDENNVTSTKYPSYTTSESVEMPNTGLSSPGQVEKGDIITLYKKWLDGTYPNYGLKIHANKNNQTNSGYCSSDHTNQAYRPYIEVTYTVPLSKEVAESNESATVPTAFVLYQNYPNPFNPTTTINFALPKASQVSLKVYDMLGKEVSTVFDGFVEAGEQIVQFNALVLPSGAYFYRLEAGQFNQTRKMVLLK